MAGIKRPRTKEDVEISLTVGRNVRRLRERRRLSLRALAEIVVANGHHSDVSVINRIEIGTHRPGMYRRVTVDELVWLAEALGVQPQTLLTSMHEPQCAACLDTPPQGFTCNQCKSSNEQ